MDSNKKKQVLICLLSCVLSPLAISAPITFDFTGDELRSASTTSTGYRFFNSSGTQSVDTSPYAEGAHIAYPYASYSSGLGVLACYSTCTGVSTKITNSQSILLDFSNEVVLLSATFSAISENDAFNGIDQFSLTADGSVLLDHAHYGSDRTTTLMFGNSFYGKEFEFLSHGNGGFLLKSVTAEFVSEVPEPASLALLGMGLAVLSGTKRRKNHVYPK